MIASRLVADKQRNQMLRMVPGAEAFTVTILSDVLPGTAHALAMLAAAATETRVQSLEGFGGAAFLASAGDDMLLQFVQWRSASVVEAWRNDDRYTDHADIIEDHSRLCYHGSSPHLLLNESFGFTRGDRVVASGTEPRAALDDSLLADLAPPADGKMFHITPGVAGRSVVMFSKTDDLAAARRRAGELRWINIFHVVEVVVADRRAAARPVGYRLLRPVPARNAGASEAETSGAIHA